MDLQDIASEISNVSDYLNSRNPEPPVKVGDAPTGNLTALEISEGKTGSTTPINGTTAPKEMLPTSVPSFKEGFLKYKKPILIIGALGLAFFIFKRKNRG